MAGRLDRESQRDHAFGLAAFANVKIYDGLDGDCRSTMRHVQDGVFPFGAGMMAQGRLY